MIQATLRINSPARFSCTSGTDSGSVWKLRHWKGMSSEISSVHVHWLEQWQSLVHSSVTAVPSCQSHLPAQLLLSTSEPVSAQMRTVTRDFLFEPLQHAGFSFTDPDAYLHLSLSVVGSNFCSQDSSCWKKKCAYSQGILVTKHGSLRLPSSLSERCTSEGAWIFQP